MRLSLDKYWRFFLISWQNSLAYPISIFFWRLRQFLATFMALSVWGILFANQQQAFGYQHQEIVTYIFLTGLLQSIILATVLGSLAEDIYTGKISTWLLKPMNIYGYFVMSELSDKLKNFLFIIGETTILYALFKPEVLLPEYRVLVLFLISALLGAVLMFFIMLLFGTIGFWSRETWGPRFLFYMFLEFTAGRLFPLTIFPPLLQKIVFLTPFPYLSYVQTQIFLGRISGSDIWLNLFYVCVWIGIISTAFRLLWQKGIREYGALGH